MRPIIEAVMFAVIALLLGLCMAYAVMDTHGMNTRPQLRNAYHPFTVELQVRDL